MFIVTAKFSRRKAALSAMCLLALITLSVALLSRGEKPKADAVKADTNDARVDYLRSCGWEVKSEPVETLSVEEAAERYYRKSASNLTIFESATLTCCLPNPLKRTPEWVGRHMSTRRSQILALSRDVILDFDSKKAE